jgi:surfactin synthase thioesterase subunit
LALKADPRVGKERRWLEGLLELAQDPAHFDAVVVLLRQSLGAKAAYELERRLERAVLASEAERVALIERLLARLKG